MKTAAALASTAVLGNALSLEWDGSFIPRFPPFVNGGLSVRPFPAGSRSDRWTPLPVGFLWQLDSEGAREADIPEKHNELPAAKFGAHSARGIKQFHFKWHIPCRHRAGPGSREVTMLTDAEIQALFDKHNVPEAGRLRIQAIRHEPPGRRADGGSRSQTIRYCSKKMGFVIEAESYEAEYAALVTWEHNPDVYEMYGQPCRKLKLSYRGANGRTISHMTTADFFLIGKGGFTFVECKLQKTLLELAVKQPARWVRTDNGMWTSPPAQNTAAELGCAFHVRSSEENNWILIENLEFLRDFIVEPAQLEESVLAALSAKLIDSPWWTIHGLLAEGIRADVLYAAIVSGAVHFDITRQRLTQVEEAVVFRDAESAQAYATFSLTRTLDLGTHAQTTLSLYPGTLFSWDGRRWEVLNYGDEGIAARCLDSEGKSSRFVELSHDHLSKLATRGKIIPEPDQATDHLKQAGEVFQRFGPEAQQQAIWRHQILYGEPSKDNPYVSVCRRTRANWKAGYRRAQEQYGYGLVGLVSNWERRQGNKTQKLDQAVHEILVAVAAEKYEDPRRRTVAQVFGVVEALCLEQGFTPPSRKTVSAEIKRSRSIDSERKRLGKRAAYDLESIQNWHLSYTTPVHGTHPFHIAHIDHTPLAIKLLDESLSTLVKSVWLTLMFDAYSRTVLGYYLSFDDPSHVSCMMVIRDCVRRHGRLPQFLVTDRGPEFDSVYYETLLARSCVNKKSRQTSRPRQGSVIERFFGTTEKVLLRGLQGNTEAERQYRKVSREISPARLAIWTYERLQNRLEEFFFTVYANNHHSTLGCSPRQKFLDGVATAGERRHVYIPYTRNFIIETCPTTAKGTARVGPRGVKINYTYFTGPALTDLSLRKKDVPVRYDPFNAGIGYVFVQDRWQDVQSEYFYVFEGRTTREIELASVHSRLDKRIGERLRDADAAKTAAFLQTTESEEVLAMRRLHDKEQRTVRWQVPNELVAPDTAAPASSNAWFEYRPKALGDLE